MNGSTELLKPAANVYRKQGPRELSFSCPECGGSELGLRITGVEATQYVEAVYDDGRVEFGETIDEITDMFYECACCEYRLRDDSGNCVREEEDLVNWLREHRNQDVG